MARINSCGGAPPYTRMAFGESRSALVDKSIDTFDRRKHNWRASIVAGWSVPAYFRNSGPIEACSRPKKGNLPDCYAAGELQDLDRDREVH
jgi:hypothetical protein